MGTKIVSIDGIGEVSLYKRKGTTSVRISLSVDGTVRVTLPSWAPYKIGLEYARSKSEWIMANRKSPKLISDGMAVGKAHHIHFEASKNGTLRTRIRENGVYITVPDGLIYTDPAIQNAAEKASLRAIRFEAETLLPQRLRYLAKTHEFNVKSIAVRRLKGRWGSCSQHKEIVLNLYLMQLPWELIDYVLFHELVHTRIMAHGTPFWDEVAKYVPNLPAIRKQMRQHQPTL